MFLEVSRVGVSWENSHFPGAGILEGQPQPLGCRGLRPCPRAAALGGGAHVPPEAVTRFLPAPGHRQGGPGSEWVLVPGEGGELLPQSLEAGPLLRLPVPARQHELVCSGRALRRAGHAVARVHPQEGLVVGHACRGQDKGVGPGRSLPTCLSHPQEVTSHCLLPLRKLWAGPSPSAPHTHSEWGPVPA